MLLGWAQTLMLGCLVRSPQPDPHTGAQHFQLVHSSLISSDSFARLCKKPEILNNGPEMG